MGEIAPGEIGSLKEFEQRVKVTLAEDLKTHTDRFDAFYKFLSKLSGSERDSLANLINDQGVRKLLTDFIKLIEDARPDRRSVVFEDLTKEISSHLMKKGKLSLPDTEHKKRKKRIDKIKKTIIQLDNKNRRYQKQELSLDDLENGENGAVEKARKCQAKIIRLYRELRQLENRHLYYGESEIDFSNVSENAELNTILADHILKKFRKKKDEPDYVEVNELVQKFCLEKGISLDSASIFKKINLKFKSFRMESVDFILDAYEHENQETDPYEEDEELRKKLDGQNKFKAELDSVMTRFVEEAKKAQSEPEEVDESEDSESDSVAEDENELESISEHEEEFLSPERGSDESAVESECSEPEDDASKESGSQSNGEATLKRSSQIETEHLGGLKKLKMDDCDVIVLD